MGIFTASEKARHLALHESVPAGEAVERAIDYVVEAKADQIIDERQLRKETQAALFGFGALQPLLDDSSIEEIWLNAPDQIFVARAGVAESLPLYISADEIQRIIERMLRSTGRRLDRSSPFVDASLNDGSRLHVVIPDITKSNWAINIRKFPDRILTLTQLQKLGTISAEQRDYLIDAVVGGKNILVSGATQAGKTTMLCAILAEAPERERIVTVEETFEIRIEKPDWVGLQTRQPNLEGIGEVSLRRLIKESLRMRPSRLVVGEVREAESLDLLIALNSGLPGACTIHANSAADAIRKLCTLPLLAGQNISSSFIDPTVGSCIDVVVHCELTASGQRRVAEIAEVSWQASTGSVELAQVADALV